MIFVTVGTQKFQFNRLIETIDNFVSEGKIDETVFVQIGNSSYIPRNCEYSTFLNKAEFEDKIKNCNVLITHGGVATIVAGLKNNKKVIVVPRLSQFGEHVDDHQVQIAETFDDKNFVLMCKNCQKLDEYLNKAKKMDFDDYVSQRKKMVEMIEHYLTDAMR